MPHILYGKSKREIEDFLTENNLSFEKKHHESILVKIKDYNDAEKLGVKEQVDNGLVIEFLSETSSSKVSDMLKKINSRIDQFNKSEVDKVFILIRCDKSEDPDLFVNVLLENNDKYSFFSEVPTFNLNKFIHNKKEINYSKEIGWGISATIFVLLSGVSLMVSPKIYGGGFFALDYWIVALLILFISLKTSKSVVKKITNLLNMEQQKTEEKIFNTLINKSSAFKAILVSLVIMVASVFSSHTLNRILIEDDIKSLESGTVITGWNHSYNEGKTEIMYSRIFNMDYNITGLQCEKNVVKRVLSDFEKGLIKKVYTKGTPIFEEENYICYVKKSL